MNLDTDYPVHLYDDYDFDNGNNNADNSILEVPRGREGRRLPSGSSLVSNPVLVMGRMAEIQKGLPLTPPISPRSVILSPISPSMNIPHSPNSQPASRSRPRTAPTATTTISSSPLASPSASRPGTADSTGPIPAIRHHMLDSIRGTAHGHVQGHRTPGHRTPPTRDSSPSRSV